MWQLTANNNAKWIGKTDKNDIKFVIVKLEYGEKRRIDHVI